jgi:predicted small lipoprotein YifL
MKRSLSLIIATVLTASLAACAGKPPAQIPGTQAATNTAQPATTATEPSLVAPDASATRPAPGSTSSSLPPVDPAVAAQLTNTCGLLNSQDLATILVTGELVKEPVQVSQVGHPIFTTQPAPADEVTCVFYEFHNPGKSTQELLQVTYWVDMPGQEASAAAWGLAWSQAAQAGQAVTGAGDQAFFDSNGRLTFRQGDLYFTVEIVDTSRTPEQRSQIAKQVAADMLQHLAALPGAG